MARQRTSLMFCVGLIFPRFNGEPDGGVAFKHQATPFCLIETGYSDSARLTRSRAMHWIVRGQPGVSILASYHTYSNLLQVRVSVSVKIESE